MKNFLTYIRSIDFAITICLVAMAGQAFHTFYSNYAVSSIKDDLFRIPESFLFVLAFDSFTLFFLARGKTQLAKFFSVCLGIMNEYYYYDSMKHDLGVEFCLGTFISIIMPTAIYFVAEQVKEEYDKETANKITGTAHPVKKKKSKIKANTIPLTF